MAFKCSAPSLHFLFFSITIFLFVTIRTSHITVTITLIEIAIFTPTFIVWVFAVFVWFLVSENFLKLFLYAISLFIKVIIVSPICDLDHCRTTILKFNKKIFFPFAVTSISFPFSHIKVKLKLIRSFAVQVLREKAKYTPFLGLLESLSVTFIQFGLPFITSQFNV